MRLYLKTIKNLGGTLGTLEGSGVRKEVDGEEEAAGSANLLISNGLLGLLITPAAVALSSR